jgi:hypothetical protein
MFLREEHDDSSSMSTAIVPMNDKFLLLICYAFFYFYLFFFPQGGLWVMGLLGYGVVTMNVERLTINGLWVFWVMGCRLWVFL